MFYRQRCLLVTPTGDVEVRDTPPPRDQRQVSGQALIGNVPIEMGSNAFEPVSVQPDRTRDGLDL